VQIVRRRSLVPLTPRNTGYERIYWAKPACWFEARALEVVPQPEIPVIVCCLPRGGADVRIRSTFPCKSVRGTSFPPLAVSGKLGAIHCCASRREDGQSVHAGRLS
jgi:hypothetical protein